MRTTLTGVFLTALLLGGCGSNTPDATTAQAPSDGVVLELGDTGGTFELRDGTTLVVPDEAFDDGETLIVDYGVKPELPDGYTSLGAPFDIHATSGDQPSVPIDLVVPYDQEGALDGIPLEDLFGVSTLNETTDLWDPLDVTFDTTANTMTAAVTSFSFKWPWEWDWESALATVSDNIGKAIGIRAGSIECPRGTSPPAWFSATSFSNDPGGAIRACVESDTKNPETLVIELLNNRTTGEYLTWDIPVIGDSTKQASKAIVWTWSEMGPAQNTIENWISEGANGRRGLYLPPLGRATVALQEDNWLLATSYVPGVADIPRILAVDATLKVFDIAFEAAMSAVGKVGISRADLRDETLRWVLTRCTDIIVPIDQIRDGNISAGTAVDLIEAAGKCLLSIEMATIWKQAIGFKGLAEMNKVAKTAAKISTYGQYLGQAGVYLVDTSGWFGRYQDPAEYNVLAHSRKTFPEPPDLTELILSPEGLGPLKYGATIDQAEASGLVQWDPAACPKDIYGTDYGNFTVDNTLYPLGNNPVGLNDNFGAFGVSLNADTETVNWIEVYNPAIATSDGLHVGDPVTKLWDAYGEDNLQHNPNNRISAESYVTWVNRGPVDVEFEIFSGPEGVDRDTTPTIWRIAVIETGFPKDPHWQTGNVPGSCSG